MLKKTIKYENLDGETVDEEFIFHLSKAELLEMEVTYPGGFQNHLNDIIKREDTGAQYTVFKDLVLKSYGQRSDDGKRLVKSAQAREEFASSEAFSELVVELARDADKALAFISGIMPTGLNSQITAANAAAAQAAEGNVPGSGGTL